MLKQRQLPYVSLSKIDRNRNDFLVVEETLHYENILSLKAKLQHFLQASTTIEVTITSPKDSNNKEKKKAKKVILEALEKLPLLRDFRLKNFDKEANQRIQMVVQKNTQPKDWAISISFLVGSIAFLCSLPVLTVLLYAGTAFFMSQYYTKVLHRYTLEQKPLYNSAPKIKKIDNSEIMQALVSGIDAYSWYGYLISFVQIETYVHFSAFAAAKSFSINQEKDLIKEINKLRPS